MKVTLTLARRQWHELVRRAEAGEEIVIARRGKADLRLIPFKPGVSANDDQSCKPSVSRVDVAQG